MIGYCELPIFNQSGLFVYGQKYITLWPACYVHPKLGRNIGIYTGIYSEEKSEFCRISMQLPQFLETMVYGNLKLKEVEDPLENDHTFVNVTPGLMERI